jgi:DNA-binding transcriptional MerR regulator
MDVKVKLGREARMRIGDLARATGVSPRLLRYYEEQGLLRPARRANGYREYTASDVAEVSRIRALLAAGLRTEVIAQVRDCVHDDGERLVSSGCSGIVDHLQRERARIADAIERLQRSQQALDTLLTVEPSRGAEPTADGSEQQ